ncbi:MAG: hypothetical protein IPJ65_42250 [Archangiaceae bacterium]|nr:hypothetical protein [Archangiaceae bacterium]
MFKAGTARNAPRSANRDPEGLAPLKTSKTPLKAGVAGAAARLRKVVDAAHKAGDRFETKPARPTKIDGMPL